MLKMSFFLFLSISIPAQTTGTPFFIDSSEYQNLAQENYVDVTYEYTAHDAGNAGTFSSGKLLDVAKGFWDNAEKARRRVICQSRNYRVIANLQKPGVDAFQVGSCDFLAEEGIVIEVEDGQGTVYCSRLSPVKARQNTWRAGYYYYDAHLLDFELASEGKDCLPLKAEMVIHAYSDKVHIEARLTLEENIDLKQATLVCHLKHPIQKTAYGWLVRPPHQPKALGIFGGQVDSNQVTVTLQGDNKPNGILAGHLVFFPGNATESLKKILQQEAQPLTPDAFKVRDGLYLGYDAAKGFYRFKNINGPSAQHFTSFHRNPTMYLSTGIAVANDTLERKIYIQHTSEAGSIECAVLTDNAGFPLPVPIECAKNFGGEKEEPDDTFFNESYFSLTLKPTEKKSFNVLHLHQNWGNHGLRQLSSIRFFQTYYHLSQGVTETTCFSLATKFGTTPAGEPRAYTLADYRPLSGQTWHGSPQHHHVALEGWLQYLDAGGNWRYPVYTGSKIFSAGPNLAWFTLNYVSSDGKVDQHLEIFEMPQADESRTHVRMRYTFKEDVKIGGEVTRNLRLLNKGSYIRKLNWQELAWTDRDGQIQTHPIQNNGQWAVTGEELRPYNAFFCAYPHGDGNPGLVLRQVSGQVNGAPFSRVGFSAIGHEDGKSELMLVPLIAENTIRKGSVIEVDCILIPYGNEHARWSVPYEESIRYGLNQTEYKNICQSMGRSESKESMFGPQMNVIHGKKILNLPPVVKVQDNYATVTWKGGHDRISLIASGFSHPKYPLLWEDKAWLDFQVKGHDGIQCFENRDGSYGFVFTPQVRTTCVTGKWGSAKHTFHVTQALSESDIQEISSLNGRIKITQVQPGRIELVSPRLWCPARHTWLDKSLSKMTSQAQIVETVPIEINGEGQPRAINIDIYGPDHIQMEVTSPETIRMTIGGLYPESVYRQKIDDRATDVKTNRRGVLTLTLTGKAGLVSIQIQK